MSGFIVDAWEDMSTKEMCELFDKDITQITVAIARMVEKNPDKEWKYKKNNRVHVKADGIRWLSENYFKVPKYEVSGDAEMVRLQTENEYLKKMMDQMQAQLDGMKEQYRERLQLELEKQHQTFLIEEMNKEQQISQLQHDKAAAEEKMEQQISKLQQEVDSYEKTWFGLYKKKGK